MYHNAATCLANVGNNKPKNSQIYIYDDLDEAERMRIDLNIRLEHLLRKVNPYAQKYKMLHEMTISREEYVLNFIK